MAESVENDQQILITMALFGFTKVLAKNNLYTGGARKKFKKRSALRLPSKVFTPIMGLSGRQPKLPNLLTLCDPWGCHNPQNPL